MRNTVSRIGVAVDSRAPVATLVEQARAAESAGADRIWIACHLFLREPVVSAYAALAATSQLQVSLMAMSPYTVHPVYLAGKFRRHYGASVGEYVRRLRLKTACRELSHSDAPLSDIAAGVGFYDQSHFTNACKRLTGMTPAQYRAAFRRI